MIPGLLQFALHTGMQRYPLCTGVLERVRNKVRNNHGR